MAFETGLNIRVRAHGEGELRGLDGAMQRTGRTATATHSRVNRLGGAFGVLRRSVFSLQGAFAALGGTIALREISQAADAYREMGSQIALVAEDVEATRDALYDLAQETRAGLEPTVNLFARLARASEDLGASQGDVLDVTRAVNQAFVISGASASEASAAVIQLSQGLAAGTLRGDELNSVLEQAPRLARAIADELEVSVGQLRALGAEGQLTSRQVFDALLSAAEDLNDEFQSIERTSAQAFQQLQNSLTRSVGLMDEASGYSDQIADAFDQIRAVVESQQFQSGIANTFGVIADTFAFVVNNSDTLIQVLTAAAGVRIGSRFGVVGALAGGTIGGVIGGELIDDDSLAAQLEREVQALRQQREELASRGGGIFGSPTLGGIIGGDDSRDQALADLDAQIAETEQRLRSARFLRLAEAGLGTGYSPDAPLGSPRRRGGGSAAAIEETGTAADSAAKSVRTFNDVLRELERDRANQVAEALAKVSAEIQTYRDRTEALRLAQQAGDFDNIRLIQREIELRRELGEQADDQIAHLRAAADEYDSLSETIKRQQTLATGLGDAFESAFGRAFLSADSFGDAVTALLNDIIRQLTSFAVSPAFDAFGGLLQQGISSAFGGGPGQDLGSYLAGRGGVFPMGSGGLIGGARTFPFARGTGLAGEAGIEGVFPLQTTRDGRLGVAAAGAESGPLVIINDNRTQGGGLEQRETRGPDGKRMVEVFITDTVNRNLEQGRFDTAMRSRYAVTPGLQNR